ncbi:MAG: M48 family metallopeptidase [Nitrospirales bacterium]|nr:M48 family metallopeptidase [Nitrospira sp.]MDR4500614.1 M48 family metallopeptidase [Nitrospirales bacterium]
MNSHTPRTEWNGIYYDGVSATPHRVTIQIRPTGLQIIARSGSQLSWHYQDIRQTQGKYSGEEVRLERGNGICETLVISDTAILDSLHQIAHTHVTHFHNPARRRQRVLLTIFAGLASIPLFWLAFSWGIPWLSGPITTLIPVSWEEELGKFMTTKLAPPGKRCTDAQVIDSLQSIVNTLSRSLEDNPYAFTLTVVDDTTKRKPSSVNALAAPGGQILVFRGLLEKTQTAEEMAGVLAHEMQHIFLRHSMRLLVQQASIGIVVGALSGDVSGLTTFGLQATQLLQTLSYNREVEEEADRGGMRLLLRAGIDPQGMLNFFDTIDGVLREKEHSRNIPEYLSTHPSSQERLTRLKAHIPSIFQPTISFPSQMKWKDIRERCNPQKTQQQGT